MNCERYIILLDEYLNNELDETVRGSVAAHLADCSNCREELGFLQVEANIYGQAAQFREMKFADKWEESGQQLFAKTLLEVKQSSNLQTVNSAEKFSLFSGLFSGFRNLFLINKPVFGGFAVLFLGIFVFVLLRTGNNADERSFVAETQLETVIQNEIPNNQPFEIKPSEIETPPPIAILPTDTTKNAASAKIINIDNKANKVVSEKASLKIESRKQPEKIRTEIKETPVEIANNLENETDDKQLNNHLNKVHLFLLMFRNLKKDETINAVIGGKYQNEAQMILDSNSNYKKEMLKNRHIPEAELLSEIEPVLTAIAKLDAQTEKNNFEDITAMMKQTGIVFKMRLRMSGNKTE